MSLAFQFRRRRINWAFVAWLALVPMVSWGQSANLNAPRTDVFQTLNTLLRAARALSEQGRPTADVTEELLTMAGEARQSGLDQDAAVNAQVQAGIALALAEAYRQKLARSITVTDEQLVDYLAMHPGDYDEFRLSHIFVAADPTEVGKRQGARTSAMALRKVLMLKRRLDAGASFVRMAAQESEDRDTAADGGALSSVFGKNLMDEFLPVVRNLKPGEVSGPVRGPNGYHLIRLESVTRASLTNMRPHIEADLREEALAAAVSKLVVTRRQSLDAEATSTTAGPGLAPSLSR